MKQNRTGMEIAVIGMAGRFPGADSLEEFWNNLREGKESVTFFTDEELEEAGVRPNLLKSPRYVKAKGAIRNPDSFDGDFFGYSPIESKVMDPQIRILHECTYEALEDAGYNPFDFAGLIGFYGGSLPNHTWEKAAVVYSSELEEQFETLHLMDKDFMNSRISHKLDLRGPSLSLSTACSTSLTSVHMASRALIMGECHMAVAGGSTLLLPSTTGYIYHEDRIFSKDGHCRVFDENSTGTVPGEGAGMVVLKLLNRAEADGDNIYAVVKGSAINSDGSHKMSYTAPNVEGPASAIKRALQFARVEPESISYMEAHATGTYLGDQIEFEAIQKGLGTNRQSLCHLGSHKPNLGYLGPASGIVSFIKTVLSLHKREIPPTINHETPIAAMQLDKTPFRINTTAIKWENPDYPLRAGVNNIAVGGTNAHVILEEAPPRSPLEPEREWKILPFSARSPEGLREVLGRMKQFLEKKPGTDLENAAYTLQVGRRGLEYRSVVVCRDTSHALERLTERMAASHSRTPEETPPLYPIFEGEIPGGRETFARLFAQENSLRKIVREVLEDPAAACPKESAEALLALLSGTEGKTDDPALIRSAAFLGEYALVTLLLSLGLKPEALVVRSGGFPGAGAVAGLFSPGEALGRLLQKESEGTKAPPLSPQAETAIPLLQETGERLPVPEGDRLADLFFRKKSTEGVLSPALPPRSILLQWSETNPFAGREERGVDPETLPLLSSVGENLFYDSLGELWKRGFSLQWSALYGEKRRARLPLPTYPFETKRWTI